MLRIASNPSESLPFSSLLKGIHVLWDHPFTLGDEIYEYIWFEVVDFDRELIRGKALFTSPGIWIKGFEEPGHFGRIFEFKYNEVWSARGSMEWNIENLYVSCSRKVLNGEPIGFFYNSGMGGVRHYERSFFAISELPDDKYEIPKVEIPLKRLLELDDSVRPYLEDNAFYGVIRNDQGGFNILTQDNIKDKDVDIYPCTIVDFRSLGKHC